VQCSSNATPCSRAVIPAQVVSAQHEFAPQPCALARRRCRRHAFAHAPPFADAAPPRASAVPLPTSWLASPPRPAAIALPGRREGAAEAQQRKHAAATHASRRQKYAASRRSRFFPIDIYAPSIFFFDVAAAASAAKPADTAVTIRQRRPRRMSSYRHAADTATPTQATRRGLRRRYTKHALHMPQYSTTFRCHTHRLLRPPRTSAADTGCAAAPRIRAG